VNYYYYYPVNPYGYYYPNSYWGCWGYPNNPAPNGAYYYYDGCYPNIGAPPPPPNRLPAPYPIYYYYCGYPKRAPPVGA
jgi:hypothetical protein